MELDDFKNLFEVAGDKAIWAMHPNKDRYKRSVFSNFFQGAFESGGAYIIYDKKSNKVIGSTRFYDLDVKAGIVFIGYTFYAVDIWGKNVNSTVKKLMLDHIFKYVSVVYFHVGKDNFRSIKAMEKLGAVNRGEITVAYFGEAQRRNILFEIKKEIWSARL